jgi:hypothetical protein
MTTHLKPRRTLNSLKKLKRTYTYIHRCDLPGGQEAFSGKARTDETLKTAIKAYDPAIEFHFNPHNGKIQAYRVLRYGVTSGEDYLIHEFDLKGVPGWGVLTEMGKRDSWRMHKSKERSIRERIRDLDNTRREDVWDKKVSEFSQHTAKELLTYGVYGRVSLAMR